MTEFLLTIFFYFVAEETIPAALEVKQLPVKLRKLGEYIRKSDENWRSNASEACNLKKCLD